VFENHREHRGDVDSGIKTTLAASLTRSTPSFAECNVLMMAVSSDHGARMDAQ
jgi:hypothetical protein